ncbi:MAG: WbqC family protein [Nitrospiraceae bacterium]
MKVTIHQPQFLPWLGYLDKIARADLFVVLDQVQFKKQEWQNRNRIRTACKWQWLTVPVLQRFGQRIDEVRVNRQVDWRRQHLRALTMHYAKAPYQNHVLAGLRSLYEADWERLVDLNLAVLRWLMETFHITTPIRLASELSARNHPTDRLIDICRAVGASTYLAGPGAEQYLDRPRFEASGLELELQRFRHPVYAQCYHPFIPDMSALDLLMMEGRSGFRTLVGEDPVRGGMQYA